MDKVLWAPKNDGTGGHPLRRRGKGDDLNILKGVVLSLLLFTISGFMLYQSYKSLFITQKKVGIYEQARIDVDTLRLENLDLLLEGNRVQTDEFVETEGRDRLHLSKPGEFVFIIAQDVMASEELDLYYESLVGIDLPPQRPAGLGAWLLFLKEGI